MKLRNTLLGTTLVVALGVNSVNAGEVVTPPPSGSNGAEKVLIAAVVIGVLAWAFGGSGNGNAASREAPAEDDGKGEILMEF
ncbi:hypothetical protein [Halocynthiibacter styelae]|uniref:Uncharacterized protein n=1 Tax=Halocynthiibacter styelae TaxID=2761955 RepID=A0A8J7IHS9_9RHOB|nr:hypothetical protein [Paenihalocynthiibacter styelae]MBI1492428.1 hypothetical protein [Paenihalocynthiibacter styelae]